MARSRCFPFQAKALNNMPNPAAIQSDSASLLALLEDGFAFSKRYGQDGFLEASLQQHNLQSFF